MNGERKKKAEFDNDEKVIEDGVGPDGNYISAVTVGFEIEGIGSVRFKKKDLKSYAKTIVKSQIYDLATALGAESYMPEDFGNADPAFGYVMEDKKKIFGLYLDIPPKIEMSVNKRGELQFGTLLNSKFTKITESSSILPLELKTMPSRLKTLSECNDSYMNEVYQIVNVLSENIDKSIGNGKQVKLDGRYEFGGNKNAPKFELCGKGGEEHRMDINYGVPINENLIKNIRRRFLTLRTERDKSLPKEAASSIGKGHESNQELRAELPFKTPLEFLDNQNTDIIPPKGVALWDVQERIKHLKYIKACVEKGKKTEDQSIDTDYSKLMKKIETNIGYCNEVNLKTQVTSKKKVIILKSEIKKPKISHQNIKVEPPASSSPIQLSSTQYLINAFDTPHHTAVMVEGKVIFEIRDYMLNKDGKLFKKNARANIEEIYNEKVVVYRKNFSFKTLGKKGRERKVWGGKFTTKKDDNVAPPINAEGNFRNDSSDTGTKKTFVNKLREETKKEREKG